MTVHRRLRLSICLLSLSAVTLAAAAAVAQERESIFDRAVHIEETLITEIPETPRCEEQLELTVRRVDVGGAELYVEEEGSGVPLVLINGGPGGTHHYFHPWFGRARGFARVIYYDQRGTGLSDYEPGADGYSVEQAVDDLEALRVALGIDEWVLVGLSYGGFLAQYYTTSYPRNVAGLVLIGASLGMWVDTGRSRQYEFISEAELDRMREVRAQLRELREREGWSRQKYIRLLVYNNHINGDWKRQNYYRPTPEKFAQIALYEWVHDDDFNPIMSQSQQKVDLSGAFDRNPIPTLILEGKWDLTWGEAKSTILSRNHPNARMVVVEHAGHSIYDENPDAFFAELEKFVRDLPLVDRVEMEAFEEHLVAWRARWEGSPFYYLRVAGWGKSGSERIVEVYTSSWLDEIEQPRELLRAGFALYDAEDYGEALRAFVKLEEIAHSAGDQSRYAVSIIWQGHMLDLLGRREEAIARYQRAVDLGSEGGMRHDQYGLSYEFGPYAAERLLTPFRRLENTLP
ncbi:MAG: alpha/beta fold hydrolase [Gemmatimonadota bacterium]|nr:MAG: alpha/beta fold hydrolase [Gemmatimonadota bacterium]